MGEIKQTNFRINTETADRFRAFCEENQLNQAQGFEHVMDVLAMNQAKEIVPERKTEIEDFECHVKALMSAFLRSIEINSNAEFRVHDTYKLQLGSKDEQIIELQEELRTQKEIISNMMEALDNEEKKRKSAEETMQDALIKEQKATSALADKDSINVMLQDKLKELESKIEGYDILAASTADLEKQLISTQQLIKDIKKDAEIAQERAVVAVKEEMQQAALEAEKKLAALEKEKNKEIQKLYEKIMMLQEQEAAPQTPPKRNSKKATQSAQTQ